MNWLRARLREPSTKAGLSAIAILCGLPADLIDVAYQVVAGVLAIVAIVEKEKGQGDA